MTKHDFHLRVQTSHWDIEISPNSPKPDSADVALWAVTGALGQTLTLVWLSTMTCSISEIFKNRIQKSCGGDSLDTCSNRRILTETTTPLPIPRLDLDICTSIDCNKTTQSANATAPPKLHQPTSKTTTMSVPGNINTAPPPSSFDNDVDFYEESRWQKLRRKIVEEPLIPLGCALTCWALYEA